MDLELQKKYFRLPNDTAIFNKNNYGASGNSMDFFKEQ